MYRIICLIALCLLSQLNLAEIYQSVDDKGNIIYSDQASDKAEPVKLPKANTLPAVKVPPQESKSVAEPSDETFRYRRLAISSPAHDSGIEGGTGNIAVSVSAKPSLQKQHKIRLLMDGKSQQESNSTHFQINNVDRGSHSLQAIIVDEAGKTLKTSSTITVHVFRPSVMMPGRSR